MEPQQTIAYPAQLGMCGRAMGVLVVLIDHSMPPMYFVYEIRDFTKARTRNDSNVILHEQNAQVALLETEPLVEATNN